MSRYMQHLSCRFHPEAELIEDYRAGDMICSACGLVVGERIIDVGTEWRDFGNESDSTSKHRVGAAQNLLYDTENLETMAIGGTLSNSLNEINPFKHNKPNQVSSAEKALKSGHDAIRNMSQRIGLKKKVIDRAFMIYKFCYENKCVRGRSQDDIVATCIYIACRQEGSTRAMKEISDISGVSLRNIGRCFNKIKATLPTEQAPETVDIKNLVPRYCNQLNLSQEMLIQKTAIHIAKRAGELCDIQGRAPRSIAGATIYMACLALDEGKTKKDIQEQTGVSEGVIRDVYRLMLSHATSLFPQGFAFKRPISNFPQS